MGKKVKEIDRIIASLKTKIKELEDLKNYNLHRKIPDSFFSEKNVKRFFKKTKAKENGCIDFVASKNHKGYGIFSIKGLTIPAHRYAYMLHHKKIDKELMVLHNCDNTLCVNYEHLRLGTGYDNAMDKKRRKRVWYYNTDKCKRGHPLDGIGCRGNRFCKTCNREAQKRWQQKQLTKQNQV